MTGRPAGRGSSQRAASRVPAPPDLRILDGGLATELEARGADLSGRLWSARLLRDDPRAIAAVHHDYLAAGADCIVTASYQASVDGFRKAGLGESEAVATIRRSVQIAREVRDAFWSDPAHRVGRWRPLVAASIGPYGAFLADGSEYTGCYDLGRTGLRDFHRRRWEVLVEAGPDLLACETLPSAAEVGALVELLAATPEVEAWFSFQCRDAGSLADGTPLEEAVRLLEDEPRVVAVGVNCTPPELVTPLLRRLRGVTDRPLVAYPNSGERWDATNRRWLPAADGEGGLAARAGEWVAHGARWIGGCCRTRPDDIRALRRRLVDRDEAAPRRGDTRR